MVLSVTIAGTGRNVLIDGCSVTKRINQRSTASFTVIDTTAALFQQMQAVIISDSVLGTQFVGFVDSIDFDRLTPNDTRLFRIACKDNRWKAEKLLYTGSELSGKTSGDIACLLHQDYLAAEGVTAKYAMDRDSTQATWATGTHTGTTATALGTLELSPAGTTFNISETTTANFDSGTLDNVDGISNELRLATSQALNIWGTAVESAGNNLYNVYMFWSGSQSVASGDYLEYEVWVSSDSPEIKVGLDLIATDGYSMVMNGNGALPLDQYQLPAKPVQDLNGWANDTWYYRKINMPSEMVGMTIGSARISVEGDKNGAYNGYVRHAHYCNSGGSVLQNLYESGSTTITQLANRGYIQNGCGVVTVYSKTGTRISSGYTNNNATIVRDSLVNWTETLPSQFPTTSTAKAVKVEVSWDNGYTWTEAENHAAIPGLSPGMRVDGKVFKFRQTLTVLGTRPQWTPSIQDCTLAITPSYSMTKTDVTDSDQGGAASMGTGTLTGVSNVSNVGLQLLGQRRNWDDADISSQTLYYSDGAHPSTQACTQGWLSCRTQGGTQHTMMRMDWAGNGWNNLTAEFDVQFVDVDSDYSLVYRTTYWANANNTMGYVAALSNGYVRLGKGSNSSTPSWAVIQQVAFTTEAGKWYHVKVEANGSTHKIYVDGILYVNVTDSSYSSAGYVALRHYNGAGAGVRSSAYFDNFGIVAYAASYTGSRTAASQSISAVGTVGASILQWNANVPSNCTLDVQASVNGGSTYVSCTNGAEIPGATAGTDVSGKSLLIKIILTSQNTSATPTVYGIGWIVSSAYSASANRISPALSIDSLGRVGSSSVSWLASVPTNTTVGIDTSPTGTGSWTAITNSGDPIAGLNASAGIFTDEYDSNSASNYSATYYSGGAASTNTWDTTTSRVSLVGGTNALLVWNAPGSFADVTIDAILSHSDNGALIARYTDASNHYRLSIRDDGASSNAQKAILSRRVAGANTTLQTLTITFARDVPVLVRWTIVGAVHNIWVDGTQVLTNYTDSSPITAAGKTGMYNGTGGTSYWQMLQMQGMGDSTSGKSYYTRVRLTSTDPSATPTVQEVVLTVRTTNIVSGLAMSDTSYSYTYYVSQCLNDAARKSNGWWAIDESNVFWFQDKPSQMAPWLLVSSDPQFLYANKPILSQRSPLYRNRQYVKNVTSSITLSEKRTGDGMRQSWTLTYPLYTVPVIRRNGQVQDIGVRGVDTGMQFYYVLGEKEITQESGNAPLTTAEYITVDYTGSSTTTKMSQDSAQQTLIAGIAGGTGIVDNVEDGTGLNETAGQEVADARIRQYAVLSRDWSFSTGRGGLQPGQMLYAFVPEFSMPNLSMYDVAFFITEVTTTLAQRADTSVYGTYDVSCTEGPPLGSWSSYFALPA